jgi:uncharacterized membrane protein (DUF373 family)
LFHQAYRFIGKRGLLFFEYLNKYEEKDYVWGVTIANFNDIVSKMLFIMIVLNLLNQFLLYPYGVEVVFSVS